MALNKKTLSDALYDAETKDVNMTSDADKKVRARCEAVASAIYDFVTSAEITVTIQSLPVVGSAGPAPVTATAGPGQGISDSIT